MSPVLELHDITKRFPGVLANDHIDFQLEKGEIHALLGENGAGKSTLVNILYGLYAPDEGQIFLDGKEVQIEGPSDAIAQGIGMVHQHFMLVPVMTVAENIMLGTEVVRNGFVLDRKTAAQRIRALSGQYGLEVDPEATVADLPVGTRQRVEIIKALYRQADVLILDEPTAVLTPQEAEQLFLTISSLAGQGKSIIFITHKLKEVFQIANRITVLRNGRVVGTTVPAETSELELASMMVGREVILTVDKGAAQPGKTVLRVEELRAMDDRWAVAVDGVSLEVRAGEVLGVAGVQGNGQTELVEVLTGLRPALDGQVKINGVDVTNARPRKVIEQGVAHIPEDRHERGMIASYPVADNLVLCSYYIAPFAEVLPVSPTWRWTLRIERCLLAALALIAAWVLLGIGHLLILLVVPVLSAMTWYSRRWLQALLGPASEWVARLLARVWRPIGQALQTVGRFVDGALNSVFGPLGRVVLAIRRAVTRTLHAVAAPIGVLLGLSLILLTHVVRFVVRQVWRRALLPFVVRILRAWPLVTTVVVVALVLYKWIIGQRPLRPTVAYVAVVIGVYGISVTWRRIARLRMVVAVRRAVYPLVLAVRQALGALVLAARRALAALALAVWQPVWSVSRILVAWVAEHWSLAVALSVLAVAIVVTVRSSLIGELPNGSIMVLGGLAGIYLPTYAFARPILVRMVQTGYFVLLLHLQEHFHLQMMDDREVEDNALKVVKKFDIRTPSVYTLGASLSGGNQQKMIVAREFSRPINLLIAAQPTRGLDVGSIEFIHQQIVKKRDEGCAVLLISAELDEIMSLSDRIAVMYKGKIIATVNAEEATREELGLLMAGVTEETEAVAA